MNEQQLEQILGIVQPSPVQSICPNWQGIEQVNLQVKRDDLLHPIISGNKWRKLKYALLGAVQQQKQHIISFGGGYSNHLHALGYCCFKLNIQFTAIVRGNYSANLSPMLHDLTQWQANIHYVDRITYQKRAEPDYLQSLQAQYPQALIIPEGGSEASALQGVAEIIQEAGNAFNYIVAPVASAGTLAGLISANTNQHTKVIGIAVLKGKGYLEKLVNHLLIDPPTSNHHWQIEHDYHFGGYAKADSKLKQFCTDFTQQTQIPIEPVYSGKMFFALSQLISQQQFAQGSKILALHTGGLQGAR